MNIHLQATNKIERDQFFVYEVVRKVFGSDLWTHSLTGSAVVNAATGKKKVVKQLNKKKIEYAYLQYVIRVTSVGINEQDRNARKQRSVFNDYIRMLTDLERKKHKNMKNKVKK